jgi:thiol peroxidase
MIKKKKDEGGIKMKREVLFGGNPVSVLGDEIKVGDKADNFKALNLDLSEFDFYKDTEGKVKIISVAPSIDTPVCSLQATFFNAEATQLSDDVVIVTITVDLPFAQKRYCGANGIDNIQVVSDHRNLDFGNKYGFVMDKIRLLARGIVVVDKDNQVQYVEYVHNISDEVDYEGAIKAVKALL